MEREAGEMLLVLGGTVLLVYYGIRVRRERRRLKRHPPRDSAAWREQVRRSFEAEFGLEAGEMERLEDLMQLGGVSGFGAQESDPFGSVVCPDCGEQYAAGVPFCERCGAGTVDDDEAPERVSEQDRMKAPLVCVFTTTDTVEAAVVRSLLESHDIPTALTGPAALNVHLFYRIEAATIRLMVLEPDAEEARRILAAAC